MIGIVWNRRKTGVCLPQRQVAEENQYICVVSTTTSDIWHKHGAPQWWSLHCYATKALCLYLNVKVSVNVKVVDVDARFHERIRALKDPMRDSSDRNTVYIPE